MIITTTLTLTMAMMLSIQECNCDGICGLSPNGAKGPYQVLSFKQMEILGCPADTNWWSFYDAMPCVQMFIDWLDSTLDCKDVRMTYAAYNWGIGNVMYNAGCNFKRLPQRVKNYANFTRVQKCGFSEWVPQSHKPGQEPEPVTRRPDRRR